MKALRLFSLLLVVSLAVPSSQAQEVQWNASPGAAYELAKAESKPLIIDVYTDWCGWCKVMDRETYNDEQVSAYINSHFKAAKLDAEYEGALSFAGDQYTFNERSNVHDLAAAMLQGQMSYPSTVFFDGEGQMLFVVPGYLKKDQFMQILTFIAEGIYKEKSWEEYRAGK